MNLIFGITLRSVTNELAEIIIFLQKSKTICYSIRIPTSISFFGFIKLLCALSLAINERDSLVIFLKVFFLNIVFFLANSFLIDYP